MKTLNKTALFKSWRSDLRSRLSLYCANPSPPKRMTASKLLAL